MFETSMAWRYCNIVNGESNSDDAEKKKSLLTMPKKEKLINKRQEFYLHAESIMTTNGRICSEHFKKEDIVKNTTRTRLKAGAVPCLNSAPG